MTQPPRRIELVGYTSSLVFGVLLSAYLSPLTGPWTLFTVVLFPAAAVALTYRSASVPDGSYILHIGGIVFVLILADVAVNPLELIPLDYFRAFVLAVSLIVIGWFSLLHR